MAEAMGWVAKITTVGLEMALPAMFGSWLDSRWGTRYFGLLGVIIGVPVGISHLVQMANLANREARQRK